MLASRTKDRSAWSRLNSCASKAMNFGGIWPGATGASLTGGACGAAEPAEEGMRRLRDIMKGRTLPRWKEPPNPRFVPDWTKEDIDLCNEVIKNTQQEHVMSSADHEGWKSKNRDGSKGIPKWNWENNDKDGWIGRPSGIGPAGLEL